jgi:hypothetical protein
MRLPLVLVLALGCRRHDEPPAAQPPPPPPRSPERIPTTPATAHHHVDPPLDPAEGRLVIEPGAGTVRVRVTPGAGYHINPEYPWKLRLDPTEGVTSARSGAQISKRELAIAISYTATAPGVHAIRGQLDLAVCERDRCLPRSMPIAVEVN